MKRIIALTLALVIGAAIFAGCGNQPAEPDPAAAGYVEKPVGKVNGAALYNLDEKLLDYIAERQSGNFVISPMSFKYAYGLMLAGAEGNTKKELLGAFALENEHYINKALSSFNEYADESAGNTDLKIANSVWTREDIGSVKQSYKEKIKEYNAEYFDFSGNVAEKADEWVKGKTNGMIPRLFPEGHDTSDLVMLQLNALYFKGAWDSEFKPEDNQRSDFTKEDGSFVEKDFMFQSEAMPYYEDEDTKLVILPIRDFYSETGVVFVLGSTDDLIEKIGKAYNSRPIVNLAIPKFEVETSLENGEFCDFLKACGVADAFDASDADFSGITDMPLYVSEIIQRAKLGINEKGIEGAAATEIGYSLGFMPTESVDFKADRPFSFFVVADLQTSRHVIFEGRIVE
ncbi:MAG: serpin family protein [Clostridia bacterium]|nr:serpin family protein [Clostridia bacterium]